jgi:hypothetical protein
MPFQRPKMRFFPEGVFPQTPRIDFTNYGAPPKKSFSQRECPFLDQCTLLPELILRCWTSWRNTTAGSIPTRGPIVESTSYPGSFFGKDDRRRDPGNEVVVEFFATVRKQWRTYKGKTHCDWNVVWLKCCMTEMLNDWNVEWSGMKNTRTKTERS